jgi:hypothetical protein
MNNTGFLSHQSIFDQAVKHLFSQGCAALLPQGGGAYRGNCGTCPVGLLIHARDYANSMEGIPVRFLGSAGTHAPPYMEPGIAALRRALVRSRVNVNDQTTVDLLSCLQNVHDVFANWEWNRRLWQIAVQFGLSPDGLKQVA